MDEIQQRLKETSDNCLKAYEKWSDSKKDSSAQEDLQEAIHELRKVSSRLEIELAISERNEMAQKSIPIPPHRDSKNKGGQGNASGGEDRNNGPKPSRGNNNRRPKKAASSSD